MEYMKVSQAAEKWGISARRVRVLCAERKIEGVIRKGNLYMIPTDTLKPLDGRYNKISLSKPNERNAVKLQTDAVLMSDSLMKLRQSIGALEEIKAVAIIPQLQQLATSIQHFSSAMVTAVQSDAMQVVLNVGQQMAKMLATLNLKPMLEKISEAMIPLKYVALLERLNWPIFLIDDESLRKDILNACKEGDNPELVKGIILEYCGDDFLSCIETEWTECSIINEKRKIILSDAMLLHRQERYYASTTMFMCQVYGVAADIENALEKKGLTLSEQEKTDAANLFGLKPQYIDKEKGRLFQTLMFTESGVFLWNAMASYLKDVCFFSGNDYSGIDNQPLRNKICHGEQLDFGTKEHSLKAILVIDMLIQLAYEINRIISDKRRE